jgi:hypothetical protein
MSYCDSHWKQRVSQILQGLVTLKDVKVTRIEAFLGPSFVGYWDKVFDIPISLEEAFSLSRSARGFTVHLEDGRIIKSRLDIDFGPEISSFSIIV